MFDFHDFLQPRANFAVWEANRLKVETAGDRINMCNRMEQVGPVHARIQFTMGRLYAVDSLIRLGFFVLPEPDALDRTAAHLIKKD